MLDGKGGLAGWSWIFVRPPPLRTSISHLHIRGLTSNVHGLTPKYQVIEGILTLLLGILAFFYVPDFPDQNRFLTPEQTALVLRRVEEDRGDSVPDKLTARKVARHVGDWTVW